MTKGIVPQEWCLADGVWIPNEMQSKGITNFSTKCMTQHELYAYDRTTPREVKALRVKVDWSCSVS